MFQRPLRDCVALGVYCTLALLVVVSACASGAREAIACVPGQPASQPASAPVFDLTPPPSDQLQPHFVCLHPDVRLEPVWYGQCYTPAWDILNTGGAPLSIRLWS